MDYSSGPYTVTFPAGQTRAKFYIPINNDSMFEGNGNFMLIIDSLSLPNGIITGNPAEATVTIMEKGDQFVFLSFVP